MAEKKDPDIDFQQLIAEERARGSRRPVKAETLELRRRRRKIAQMLLDKRCEKRDYLSVLRDDFGLKEGSPEFLDFVKLWDAYR